MRSTVLLALLCAGCPGTPTLWLAPDMAETAVKLVDSEPSPY